MPAKIDPQPAISALLSNGWIYSHPLPDVHHNGHFMRNPQCQDRRVQFRGREQCKSKDWLFGIYCKYLSRVDDMVLWADGEPVLLVLPTTYLRGIFDSMYAKVDDSDRWHVNVYFNQSESIDLIPVNYGRHFEVGQYALPFTI